MCVCTCVDVITCIQFLIALAHLCVYVLYVCSVLDTPQFNRTSSLVLGGFLETRTSFAIEFLFRSRELDGLLFYTGQPNLGKTITLHGGKVLYVTVVP